MRETCRESEWKAASEREEDVESQEAGEKRDGDGGEETVEQTVGEEEGRRWVEEEEEISSCPPC